MPTHDTYTKKDIQKAYWSFARLNHPDKGGDPSVFTETQQYFELALQEFDDIIQDCGRTYSDEDAPCVIWDVDAADFIVEDGSTGPQMVIPQTLAAPLYKAKALMLEDNACSTTPSIAERDEVADANPPCLIPLGNEHNNVHAVTVSSHRPSMFETNVVDMKPRIADEAAVSNVDAFFQLLQTKEAQTWTQLHADTGHHSCKLSHQSLAFKML